MTIAEAAALSLPRFRGHQIWRGCSPEGLHGQDAQDNEEAATPLVHPLSSRSHHEGANAPFSRQHL
jgi:hypothetical protein